MNQKVLYQKRIEQTTYNIPEYISEYEGSGIQSDFIDLAFLSGYYSRFNLDSNFPNGMFEKLYETWIRRSIERTIADKVLVAKRNGNIKAMLTSKSNYNTCNIGLVAVHRAEQGKGTGKFLLQKTEKDAYDQGIEILQVPTQSNNVIACRFYEKMGFSAIEITNYYHLWVK